MSMPRTANFSNRRARPLTVRALGGTVWCLLAAAQATVAMAQPADGFTPQPPTVTVTGSGQVQAAPDIVEITVGVVTEGATAGQALEANSKAMEQLFDVLQRQGIAAKDRQTSSFDVSPQYRHDDRPLQQPGVPQQPQIVGYQVSNLVRIKVRKIDTLGTLLDAVVSAGSNQVHGIQFSIDQPDTLKDDARRQAMRKARQKAELLAEAADVRVGKVLKIEEHEMSGPGPQPRMMMAEAARGVPIAAGEQTVEAHVTVTYRLEP